MESNEENNNVIEDQDNVQLESKNFKIFSKIVDIFFDGICFIAIVSFFFYTIVFTGNTNEITDMYITLKIIFEEALTYGIVIAMCSLVLKMCCIFINLKKYGIKQDNDAIRHTSFSKNVIWTVSRIAIAIVVISFLYFCYMKIETKTFLPIIINDSDWSIKKDKVTNSGKEVLASGHVVYYIEIEGYDKKIYIPQGRRRPSYRILPDKGTEYYVIYDKKGNVRDIYLKETHSYVGDKKIEK